MFSFRLILGLKCLLDVFGCFTGPLGECVKTLKVSSYKYSLQFYTDISHTITFHIKMCKQVNF